MTGAGLCRCWLWGAKGGPALRKGAKKGARKKASKGGGQTAPVLLSAVHCLLPAAWALERLKRRAHPARLSIPHPCPAHPPDPAGRCGPGRLACAALPPRPGFCCNFFRVQAAGDRRRRGPKVQQGRQATVNAPPNSSTPAPAITCHHLSVTRHCLARQRVLPGPVPVPVLAAPGAPLLPRLEGSGITGAVLIPGSVLPFFCMFWE